MAGFRIKINVAAFNEFRRRPEIQEELHRRGEAIAAAAGGSPDFLVYDEPNKTRSRVVVITATQAGRELEATDRSLTRALDAGRQ